MFKRLIDFIMKGSAGKVVLKYKTAHPDPEPPFTKEKLEGYLASLKAGQSVFDTPPIPPGVNDATAQAIIETGETLEELSDVFYGPIRRAIEEGEREALKTEAEREAWKKETRKQRLREDNYAFWLTPEECEAYVNDEVERPKPTDPKHLEIMASLKKTFIPNRFQRNVWEAWMNAYYTYKGTGLTHQEAVKLVRQYPPVPASNVNPSNRGKRNFRQTSAERKAS